MMYGVEMASRTVIFLPNVLKIVKAFRFCLSNLNGFNVDIAYGKEL
jgi:hypothetical protein